MPRWIHATTVAALALSASATVAAAQEAPPILQLQEAPEAPTAPGSAEEPTASSRNFDMEFGFRMRHMTVPDSLLDIWFTDDDTPGYEYSEPRPKVNGYAVGVEFVLKNKADLTENGGNNGIFYVEYVNNLTPAGLWDDQDSPQDFNDGDFIVPSNNFGLITIGANYGYEIYMVKPAKTDGDFGLSFLVGGGLGAGIILGELEYWRPAIDGPAWERYANGAPSAGVKKLPSVLPIVDVNVGLRFTIAERVVLRFEGGLHNTVHVGGTLGMMF